MDTVFRASFSLLIVLLVPIVGYGQSTQPDLVSAQLLGDVDAVAAGAEFRLAVLLKIKPGWHIYWKDSGDAGVPTSVRVTLPEGFRAETPRWPVPKTFTEAGGIVSYGYENEAPLVLTVHAPQRLVDGATRRFSAEVTWLACADRCVPGSAKVHLDLPVSGEPQPANAERVAAWEKHLPVLADAPNSPARAMVTSTHRQPANQNVQMSLNWNRPLRKVEFYPPVHPALKIDRDSVTIETNKRATRIQFEAGLIGDAKTLKETLDALVVWTDRKGLRHGLEIPVDFDLKRSP